MKILAVISSANHQGYGARLTQVLCNEAAAQGAQVEYVYLYDLNFKSCGNCETVSTEPYWCNKQDDLVPVLEKLIEADVLIWAAPIYLDYLCGTAKTFFDRFCIFVNPDFTINRITCKKVVLILTSGAKAESYKPVLESLVSELTEFFKMEVVGTLQAGGLMQAGQPLSDDLVSQAKEIATKLV
jgi:multimeric flavodoxin WrbA